MYLVIGRGNGRKVYEIPAAEVLKRADQNDVRNLKDNLCKLLGIPGY